MDIRKGISMYSLNQVAKILGYSKRTIYRMINDKRIKAVRIGKQYRISEEEVERIKKEGTG